MSEQAAIEQLIEKWCEGTKQPGEAGAQAYASYFADDATLMPPNHERVIGRDAIRDWCVELTGADGWTIHWAAEHVEVAASGDMAHGYGNYALSFKDADGNLIEDRGKWLDAFRKQADGSWRATTVAFNSDLSA